MSWDLIADVGGTNVRLAAVNAAGSIVASEKSLTADPELFTRRVAQFASSQREMPDRICVAAAGVVRSGAVVLTNSGLKLSEQELSAFCQTGQALVLNDFEAAAWSLETVQQKDVSVLQTGHGWQSGARLIVGIGTGLGVGGMVWTNGHPGIVSGEGGHVRISPGTQREQDIFENVLGSWPDVRIGSRLAMEAEALLSGTGLPVFYKAICDLDGKHCARLDAKGVLARAQAGSDDVAVQTVDLFRKHLGELIGDHALTLSAHGGVFLAGGVAIASPWVFQDQRFLDSFNAGGRHSGLRQSTPVYLFENPNFGLIGALNCLRSTTG